RKFAINPKRLQCDVTAELFVYQRRPLVVILLVLRRPPVFEISIGIKLPALVVKAMSQLVPDNAPDASVIHRIIRPCVKEWRLQNAGREDYFVEVRIVISINRRSGYPPLGAINRLADLFKISLKLKLIGLQIIQYVGACVDG